jgi:uncharacterized membrane protein YdcZ (DUF606 family)
MEEVGATYTNLYRSTYPTPSPTQDSSLFFGPIIGSLLGIIAGIVITLILLRGKGKWRNLLVQKKWIFIAGIIAIIVVVAGISIYSFFGGLFESPVDTSGINLSSNLTTEQLLPS